MRRHTHPCCLGGLEEKAKLLYINKNILEVLQIEFWDIEFDKNTQ